MCAGTESRPKVGSDGNTGQADLPCVETVSGSASKTGPAYLIASRPQPIASAQTRMVEGLGYLIANRSTPRPIAGYPLTGSGKRGTNQGDDSMLRVIAVMILGAVLAGCAAQQQRELNNAYASGQTAKQLAATACAQSDDVTGCMLGLAAVFGGGGNNAPPVVQSDLATVLNSSVLGAVVGAVRDVRVASSQERTQIASINANAQTQQAQIGAFASVATGGFSALQQATSTGYAALSSVAGSGFGAIESVAIAGQQSQADTSAAGFGALAQISIASSQAGADALAAFAAQPPTYQLGAGAVLQTGAGQIEQVGRDNRSSRECNATSNATASGSSAGTASGTTGPFAQGGSLGFYPQSVPSLECGG